MNAMPDEFELSRRKALAALGTVGVASAGAGLGTSAFFSDQETFENNQLTAGTLDMGVGYTAHYSDWSDDEDDGLDGDVRMFEGGPNDVGGADDLQNGEVGLPANDAWLIAVDEGDVQRFLDNTLTGAHPNVGTESEPEQGTVACADGEATSQADDAPRPVIELTDVKPGDFGEVTFDFVLCDNPGYVWVNVALRNASENGTTEPEADDPDEEDDIVELLDVVQAAVWVDDGGDGPGGNEDGNNYQNDGEGLFVTGSLREVLGLGSGGTGAALNGDIPADQGGGTGRNCFSAETTHSLAFAWWVPIDHGNEVQSDSVTFDLGLYAEQCRHNDGSGQDQFPLEAARTLLDEIDVGPTSRITVIESVPPGLLVREPDVDFLSPLAELHVPSGPGTYHLFLIDDMPGYAWAHSVRYAWLEAESGITEVVDAEWVPTILGSRYGFEFIDSRIVDGVPFSSATLIQLQAAPDDRPAFPQTKLHPFERDAHEDAPSGGVPAEVHDAANDQGAGDWETLCYGLVIDGGARDPRPERGENTENVNDFSHAMNDSADRFANWLVGKGYTVQRISHHHGSNLPAFGSDQDADALNENPPFSRRTRYAADAEMEFELLLEWYGRAFQQCCQDLGGGDEGGGDQATIDFVLFVKAHGHRTGFSLYHPSAPPNPEEVEVDGENRQNMAEISYQNLFQTLRQNFADCVRFFIFIDACHSGGATGQFRVQIGNQNFRDPSVLITSAAVGREARFGAGQATDFFMDADDPAGNRFDQMEQSINTYVSNSENVDQDYNPQWETSDGSDISQFSLRVCDRTDEGEQRDTAAE